MNADERRWGVEQTHVVPAEKKPGPAISPVLSAFSASPRFTTEHSPLWKRFGRGLIDLVYPPRCLVCDFPGPESLCFACLGDVRAGEDIQPPAVPGLDDIAVVGAYDGVLRDAIHGLKYRRRRGLAPPLGELMARRLEEELPRWWPDLIVPVPIYWFRRLGRGFNQSELLVGEVAALTELKADTRSLVRLRHTRSQVGLSRFDRQRNLKDAFGVRDPAAIRGRAILLVDDVCTTSATLSECATALRAAGARAVFGLALAAGHSRADQLEPQMDADERR